MVELKELLSADIEEKGRPLLNQSIVYTSANMGIPQPTSFNTLWQYFNSTPEMISLVSAIVTDTLSDGYVLSGPKVRVDAAQKMLDDNNFDALLEEWLYDTLVTGNGYLWKGKVTEDQVYSVVDNFVRDNGLSSDARTDLFGTVMDEVSFDFKQSLGVVASSTMTVRPLDKYASRVEYIQRVGGNEEIYSQDEIIHLRLMQLDGRLYGFSPVISIVSEITMLAALKDYTGNFFANNGTPNWAFVLPKELAGSKNHQELIATLRDFKKLENKQKNMVFTGELSMQKLNDFTKDMEFQNLAEYLTKIIAMVWRVPPNMYGGEMKNASGAALSNQAYYRNIAHFQKKVEDLLNTCVFKDQKITFKFKQSYKEDEIREVQIEKTKTDIAEQRMSLGLWSKAAAAKFLRIDSADFGKDEPKPNTGKMGASFIEKPMVEKDEPEVTMRNNKNTPIRNRNLG